jgi:hypothetical protein
METLRETDFPPGWARGMPPGQAEIYEDLATIRPQLRALGVDYGLVGLVGWEASPGELLYIQSERGKSGVGNVEPRPQIRGTVIFAGRSSHRYESIFDGFICMESPTVRTYECSNVYVGTKDGFIGPPLALRGALVFRHVGLAIPRPPVKIHKGSPRRRPAWLSPAGVAVADLLEGVFPGRVEWRSRRTLALAPRRNDPLYVGTEHASAESKIAKTCFRV